MCEYTAEYRVGNSSGTRIAKDNDLHTLIKRIHEEGCRFTVEQILNAIEWAETAKDGAKHYIGCCCTIRKGEASMTEYTSY